MRTVSDVAKACWDADNSQPAGLDAERLLGKDPVKLRIRFLLPSGLKLAIFSLNAARAQGPKPLSQITSVHSRGGTDGLKILVVVKEVMFRLAAVAQWAANPLFQSFGDYCSPQFFLGCSPIMTTKNRTLKHGWGPL